MNKFVIAATMAFASTGVTATTLELTDFFGTFLDATDQTTDVNENLAVDGWASTAESATSVLSNVKIEVRASMSTFGEATNNGATSADVDAEILALGNWQATSGILGGAADLIFVTAGLNIIDEDIGFIDPTETVSFGVFDTEFNPGGDWITVFDGFDSSLEAATDISFLFETNTASLITGGSNFASSFTTGTAGGLRVTYTFDQSPPPQVPVPATLALLGLGFIGLAAVRR